MDNYLVSARKYRPSTFRYVVGQKALTTTLKNAIASDKLAHAYLFCGPRGVGKTTCARIFAKTINCLHPTAEGEACNECESCVAMNEQRSFNIHELDAASNNSVDDIRTLIEQVRIPPQIGKYKVYIIDEVHMLSSQAFNAFLKTLEEPPHHAIFILATTEKHKVLPTILSRCQIYDFSRITISDIVDHLKFVAEQEGFHAEEEALNVIAQKADGGMRDALSIFDMAVSFTGGNITYKAVIENLNILDYDYYFRLTENILSGDVVESLLTLNEILSKGFDGQNLLTGLASHFRDLLLCKDERSAMLFDVGTSIRSKYVAMAQRCDEQFLYSAIELVNDYDMKYKQSRNKRLLMDLLLIYLCQSVSSEETPEKKKSIKPIITVREDSKLVKISQVSPQNTVSEPSQQVSVQPISSKGTTEPTKKQMVEDKVSSFGKMGVSLSSLGKREETKIESKEIVEELTESPVTQTSLTDGWKKFIEDLSDEEVLLKQAMTQCLPVLSSQADFEVSVFNLGQKERLEENASEILGFLRKYLSHSLLLMNVKVADKEETKMKFASTNEKFQFMAQQNSNLMKLWNEFNLGLD